MHNIIGRFIKAFSYNFASGITEGPFIIDKKWGTLEPMKDERWFQSPSGIWHPVVRGGIGNPWNGSPMGGSVFGYLELDNAFNNFSNHILDSNYVPGTSGDAIGMRFTPTEDKVLDTVYYIIDTYLGTASNVNDISVEVRTQASGVPDVSGAALETVVNDPLSVTDKWIAVSGFTQALTAGTPYWICIGDPDGNTTDRASVVRNFVNLDDSLYKSSLFMTPAQTTGGWVSGNNVQGVTPAILLAFADGSVMGVNPFVSVGSTSNDTNQKGMFLNNGFNGNARIIGYYGIQTPDNDWGSAKIWEGTDGPTGTPFAESVVTLTPRPNNQGPSGFMFSGTHSSGGYPKLTPDTSYRLVLQPTGLTKLRFFYAGSTVDDNIRACFPGGGNWYLTQESTGAWVDDTDRFPLISILFDDWEPSEAAEGAGTGTGRVFPTL